MIRRPPRATRTDNTLSLHDALPILVFGYFFFWTIHDDFPPALVQADLVQAEVGLGVAWPAAGVALAVAGWALTVLARWGNRRGAIYAARLVLVAAAAISAAATAADRKSTRLNSSH